jgi:hypothetical protein
MIFRPCCPSRDEIKPFFSKVATCLNQIAKNKKRRTNGNPSLGQSKFQIPWYLDSLESFVWIWTSRRNFSKFQMSLGFWYGDWSAQRTTSTTVVQTVRRKPFVTEFEKIQFCQLHTLNNICIVLTLTGIERKNP